MIEVNYMKTIPDNEIQSQSNDRYHQSQKCISDNTDVVKEVICRYLRRNVYESERTPFL